MKLRDQSFLGNGMLLYGSDSEVVCLLLCDQVWGQQLPSGNLQFMPLKARRMDRLLARAEVKDDKKNSQPQGDQSFSAAIESF